MVDESIICASSSSSSFAAAALFLDAVEVAAGSGTMCRSGWMASNARRVEVLIRFMRLASEGERPWCST